MKIIEPKYEILTDISEGRHQGAAADRARCPDLL